MRLSLRAKIFFCLLLCSAFAGCKKDDQAADTPQDNWGTESVAVPLAEQLTTLRDSLESLKRQAYASENEKINTTQLFLEEVANLMPNYDKAQWDRISALRQQVAGSIYTDATLSDLAKMEAYDQICEQMVAQMQEFAEKTPDFSKYSRARELLSDVLRANSHDFVIRKDYNTYARQLNALLESQPDEIKALGAAFSTLAPYPIFYGEAEM